jgi:AraC family transcriptional regulator, regulatory protein of adaptative response / DNA-3-methyladenine glycosylase II
MPPIPPPPDAICEQARLSRDARFDGLFFTAVRSTGIYCRPVCPAPAPRPRNVHYYATAAAAEAAGYRPCLRCRPELSPAAGPWRRGEAVLGRALRLIEQGALESAGVPALAERLHVGERQLRRLFASELGVSPLQVETTRRLLFAKQLLSETALSVTEIALASGFASLRRFNAAFLQAYGLAPSRLRGTRLDAPVEATERLVLRLNYRPPYDFAALLAFLRSRALDGLERVDAEAYARAIEFGRDAWLRVSRWPGGESALRLELHAVPAGHLREVVQRVRRMFDLDAEPAAIESVLARDPRLAPLLRARPGLRLPSGWDGFEIAVRAVIGQQISVAGARTLTQRLLERCGQTLPEPMQALGFRHRFPTASELATADLDRLGLTGARQRTLRALAQAVVEARLDFDPAQPLVQFVERCTALPGIGPWTAHYLALRALGQPDALPSGDLVLQKALPNDGSRASAAALASRAEDWRPWRSYAVMHLWRAAAEGD